MKSQKRETTKIKSKAIDIFSRANQHKSNKSPSYAQNLKPHDVLASSEWSIFTILSPKSKKRRK